MTSESVWFGAVVQAIAQEARGVGLAVPGFRSPPGVAGADRTVCRRGGQVMIAVRLRGRTFEDVVADVVDGVLLANGVPRGPDMRVRRRLLGAVEAIRPAA